MIPEVYLAPLQGLTDHSYRKVFQQYFTGIDRAYTPYFSVNRKNMPAKKKVAGFINAGAKAFEIIPQVLTNDPQAFIAFADMVQDMGIRMINLNMGCPYPVVTKKGKGAGMLNKPDVVDAFLYEVCNKLELQLSLKMRLGWHHETEIKDLIPVLNRYPVSEIILHPRIGEDYYEGLPRQDLFASVKESVKAPVIYNGDIFSLEDFKALTLVIPEVNALMLGRGILSNPFLPLDIKGMPDERDKVYVMQDFMNELFQTIKEERTKGQRFPQGIKEFWWHLSRSFKEPGAVFDLIKVVNAEEEYQQVSRDIWKNFELRI